MIYTGNYHADLVPATTRYPELLTMSEGELFDFGKDYGKLNGLWVNSAYLLMHCPADGVTVCGRVGRKKLSEHPNWEKWKSSMSPGEFYSHAGTQWADREVMP